MADDNASLVEAAFRCYLAQDRESALALYADDFSFTSPQDDHIDKAAFWTVPTLVDTEQVSEFP